MRDIVRDAAIITVAKQVMTDRAWMGVETFLETYSDSAKSKEELIATLSLFELVWRKYEKGVWETEGHYTWYWTTED
jgi:hypothetical protein